MNLNALQEALIPHLGAGTYQKMVEDARELEAENLKLRARIEHLERQIATHAFAGYQLH
jgi:cell division protein FtsB